jgi:hypothetical protein
LKKQLAAHPARGAVVNPELYKAAVHLAECFIDEDALDCSEVF